MAMSSHCNGSLLPVNPAKDGIIQEYRHAEIIINSANRHVRLSVQHRVSESSAWFSTVDLVLQKNIHEFSFHFYPSTEDAEVFLYEKSLDGSSAQETSIAATHPAIELLFLAASDAGNQAGIKLILPAASGYIRRTDIFQERFRGCSIVKSVTGFPLSTEQRLERPSDKSSLFGIIATACGGIVVETPQPGFTIQNVLDNVGQEAEKRLSFGWLAANPIRRKRLAVVQARKETHTIERFYMAARALNVALIAVDAPGHWLEANHGPYARLRDEFIPFDMTVDESFASRLYNALKDRELDGIITSNDRHLVGVAQAAEMLGLPTMPSEALKVATDKYATRKAEEAHASEPESFTVQSLQELDELLAQPGRSELGFPLIVKPCMGWSSDCVARVTSTSELRDAVDRASRRHEGSYSSNTGVVIEPYIDEPEVDTNMILLDGQCLFFEISDDFPSTADAAGVNAKDGNFQETQILYPTGLPETEQLILKESIQKSLVRLGFRTGIFHVEARVRNSTTRYGVDGTGLLDLRARSEEDSSQVAEPSCWLIEINSRPPGGLSDWVTAYIHGICYHAQAILAAIGDYNRFEALSVPFLQLDNTKACPQPQFHSMLVYTSPTRPGTLKNSPCEDMLTSAPEMMKNVLQYRCWYRPGEILSGPQDPSLGWLATYLVFSRDESSGREKTLELGNRVREEFHVEIE